MQYTKYIKLILKSNVFSGLIGSIIGGIIAGIVTQLVTSNSMKKQFEYQKEFIKSVQKTKEKIALKSVKNEMSYNILNLGEIKKTMTNTKTDFLDFKNSDNLLRMNKWEKHCDTLLNITQSEYIVGLQAFYFSIQIEIFKKMTNLERTKNLIKNATKILKSLEDAIEIYEKQNRQNFKA